VAIHNKIKELKRAFQPCDKS